MREDTLTLENPLMRGIGLSRDRRPDRLRVSLPKETLVVSTDSHFALREDIWINRFPQRLKDRAPRIWYDRENQLYQMGIDGKPVWPEVFIPVIKSAEDRAGASDIKARLQDMDAEGIDKEIAFPQSVQGFFSYPDFDVREWIFRGYNEYLTEIEAQAPGRFYGVGIADIWNPRRLGQSIEEIKALGLKTFMLPISPGQNRDGSFIHYAEPEMEPLWSAIEASGMPVCFHIGESANVGGTGGLGTLSLHQLGPFRKTLGEFIFGGIFDRHPGLKIIFTEANINWVPGALQDAEMLYDSFNVLLNPQIQHRPSYYWHHNCYATFTLDPVGMRLLDVIGKDRIMWSTDYPHNESTFGYSSASMQAVLDMSSEDDARKILGGTALEVYKLV